MLKMWWVCEWIYLTNLLTEVTVERKKRQWERIGYKGNREWLMDLNEEKEVNIWQSNHVAKLALLRLLIV